MLCIQHFPEGGWVEGYPLLLDVFCSIKSMDSPSTHPPDGRGKDKAVLEMRIFCISYRDKIVWGDAHLLHLRRIETKIFLAVRSFRISVA